MVAMDSCIYVVGGNHAIDETVRFQLLRLCPYEMPSTTHENAAVLPLVVRYFSGKLVFQLPEVAIGGVAQLSLFNPAGKQLYYEKLPSGTDSIYECEVGNLPPGVYFVRLSTATAVFAGKVSVN